MINGEPDLGVFDTWEEADVLRARLHPDLALRAYEVKSGWTPTDDLGRTDCYLCGAELRYEGRVLVCTVNDRHLQRKPHPDFLQARGLDEKGWPL